MFRSRILSSGSGLGAPDGLVLANTSLGSKTRVRYKASKIVTGVSPSRVGGIAIQGLCMKNMVGKGRKEGAVNIHRQGITQPLGTVNDYRTSIAVTQGLG